MCTWAPGTNNVAYAWLRLADILLWNDHRPSFEAWLRLAAAELTVHMASLSTMKFETAPMSLVNKRLGLEMFAEIADKKDDHSKLYKQFGKCLKLGVVYED